MNPAKVSMKECGIYGAENFGELDIQFVRFVFNKLKKGDRPSAIEDIIESFIQAIAPASTAARSNDRIALQTSASMNQPRNVIEFDEPSGMEVSSGKTSLIASGANVGQLIDIKKKTAATDKQYVIAYINDDVPVSRHRVGGNGAIATSNNLS